VNFSARGNPGFKAILEVETNNAMPCQSLSNFNQSEHTVIGSIKVEIGEARLEGDTWIAKGTDVTNTDKKAKIIYSLP
jgi:hypothetical protein